VQTYDELSVAAAIVLILRHLLLIFIRNKGSVEDSEKGFMGFVISAAVIR